MIVKKSELRSLERLFERVEVGVRKNLRLKRMMAEFEQLSDREAQSNLNSSQFKRMDWLAGKIKDFDDRPPEILGTGFFGTCPHLVMPLGFDEFRVITVGDDGPLVQFEDVNDFHSFDFAFPFEVIYRETQSGAWYLLEGIGRYNWGPTSDETTIHFVGPQKTEKFFLVSECLRAVDRLCKNPDSSPHTLSFPGLWTPSSQIKQRTLLATVVPEILKAVLEQKLSLRQIPWRHLEEVVAELLRAYGMQVWVTPSTHDGGRDVIARGELIPGEPTLLAVEVKQKDTVGLADVQRAIQANKDFPALLVATAGTFSGGVIREKSQANNNLRLFLKDRIALGQWIEEYALDRGWSNLIKSNAMSRRNRLPPLM